jgi:hypothetical protein
MTDFARSASQAPESVQPGAGSTAGALVQKKPTGSKYTSFEPPRTNVSTRRKNIYLPNAKSAKTLWLKRDGLTDLLDAAVELIKQDKSISAESAAAAGVVAAAAVAKKYNVTKYEDLPTEEQDIWKSLAENVVKVEETFRFVTPQ